MSVQFMTSIADAREISFRNAMPEKKPDSALLGVRRLDLLTHAALARLSFSISPQSMALAVTDWAPGGQPRPAASAAAFGRAAWRTAAGLRAAPAAGRWPAGRAAARRSAPGRRAARARPPLCRPGLAVVALQPAPPGFFAATAVVGGGHARRVGRVCASPASGFLRRAAVPGRVFARQLAAHQPRRAATHLARERGQPHARPELLAG